MIREGLVRHFGLKGQPQTLNLQGVTGAATSTPSNRVDLMFETDTGEEIWIQASSLPKVCENLPTLRWEELKQKWQHLADLPLSEVGGRVDILLGLDHAE